MRKIADTPLYPKRSDESHRPDQDPLTHPPHRANRNGTGPPRISEEEPAPDLQAPLQRRRFGRTPIHARFTRYSVGVHPN